MSRCENCKFRQVYDKAPRSLRGRIWKWHTGWCPGWNSYVKALPDERRTEVLAKYHGKAGI